MKRNMNLFYKYEKKTKLSFLSNDTLKFNLEPKSYIRVYVWY